MLELLERQQSLTANQWKIVNYVAPKATLAALVPAFGYFASWYILAVAAFLFIGIETKGRTIDELDTALAGPVPPEAVAS